MKLLPGFVLRRFAPSARGSTSRARTRRAKWSRHHLRAALWLLAFFAVSQLVLGVCVDRTTDVRDPEYAILRDRLRARASEGTGKRVAVFFGSSRVAYAFDPDTAGDDSAVLFNFGILGSGPYLQDTMHERLTAEGVRPDVALLEVFPAYFNTVGVRRLENSLLDGARLNAREATEVLEYADRPAGPLRRWALARLLPINRHQAELRTLTGLDAPRDGSLPDGPQREIRANGFRPKPIPPEQFAELTALAHKQYDPFYTDFRLAEEVYERLARTITRARAHGSRAVLVLMPEGTEFRRLYTPAYVAGVDALLKRLRAETGAPIVDTRDWLPDSVFYDQHHPTPEGAALFSARFRRDVLPLVTGR